MSHGDYVNAGTNLKPSQSDTEPRINGLNPCCRPETTNSRLTTACAYIPRVDCVPSSQIRNVSLYRSSAASVASAVSVAFIVSIPMAPIQTITMADGSTLALKSGSLFQVLDNGSVSVVDPSTGTIEMIGNPIGTPKVRLQEGIS